MKFVVIGGTGLIGSKVVARLAAEDHSVVVASPQTGVNTITGEGLAAALAGADVVVDVTNSPSFAPDAVMAFFTTSTRNVLAAEAEAGVRHHVALSVVGTDRSPDSAYFRAKLAQERLIAESPVPWSVVRATQFFEFAAAIADSGTVDGRVLVPPAHFQPIAAADVSAAVASVALGAPLNGIVDVAGPTRYRFDAFLRDALRARHDPRQVIEDPRATYFGAALADDSLVPTGAARLGATGFDEWSARQA